MIARKLRRKKRTDKEQAQWRFERQRRENIQALPGPTGLVLVLDRLKPDFNVGKIFRSAHAFGAEGIHLIGIPHFDPGPGVGSFKRVPAHFHDSWEECLDALQLSGHQLFALDPKRGKPLDQSSLPFKSALLLGHEEFGLSTEVRTNEEISFLKINQLGVVDSLNVSVAASIAMYEYSRQHLKAAIEGGQEPDHAQNSLAQEAP